MSTTTNTTNAEPASSYSFPLIHSFPPFYTLQPNTTTLQAQLSTWSSIIQAYCRHQRHFKLSISDSLESPLFANQTLSKRLKAADVRQVLEFMRQEEKTAEPVAGAGDRGKEKNVWWIWWRRVEDWASLLESWVDETGQKNTVLTLYELTEGDMTKDTEFHNMDPEVLQKALAVLVKRGKAQVFGSEDQQGVKFF